MERQWDERAADLREGLVFTGFSPTKPLIIHLRHPQTMQKTCRTFLWFVCGLSKATALTAHRSSGPTAVLHNQREDFSLFSHTCCYAPMLKPKWFMSITPLREKSNMPRSHGEETPGRSQACYYSSKTPSFNCL